MTKFNVGDKVMFTNVRAIEFAGDYFKDGDITEVVETGTFMGATSLDVLVPHETADGSLEYCEGKPVLYILGDDELRYLAKVLPANAKKEETE